MKLAGAQRVRLSKKISSAVNSKKPLRALAGNLSKVAKSALDEASSLVVEEVTIELKRLPTNLDGFRIVHLSDTHHSPLTGLEHIEKAVEISNSLNPDITLLTGDYVSDEAEYVAPVAKTLAGLESRLGTYACLGNHDHWTDAKLVTEEFEAQGIRMLVNEGLRLEHEDSAFWLCGVDDHMVRQTDVPASLRGSYPDEMKILLAHNPIILRRAVRNGIDLMLSGHTHGGQVKLVDKPTKPTRLTNRYTSGLHRRLGTQIYITRGIGTVVLPVRYQCPPEVSLLTLRCAS